MQKKSRLLLSLYNNNIYYYYYYYYIYLFIYLIASIYNAGKILLGLVVLYELRTVYFNIYYYISNCFEFLVVN